jgi:excisionase family DNA binding protein
MAKTTTPPQTELTTSEVAERLEISSEAVRGLILRGRFPNVRKLPKFNGTYLIPLSDLENYLPIREARKRQKSASSPKTD